MKTRIEKAVRRYVRDLWTRGYIEIDAAASATLEAFSYELAQEKDAAAAIRDVVQDEARRRDRAEARWPSKTDCDRLSDAFGELAGLGFLAREDLACCHPCAVDQLEKGAAAVIERGDRVRFVFFHAQDTDAAIESGELYLSFGAFLPHGDWLDGSAERHFAAAARVVVSVLAKSGLTVDWDGNSNTRIRVKMKWMRRRTAPWDHPLGRVACAAQVG